MTDIQNTTGESAREKRPTVLKGLFFLIILLLVCGGLVIAATQLRSKEGPKVATLAPTPMAVQVTPVDLITAFTLEEYYSGLAEARRSSSLGFSSGGRIDSLTADVGDRVKQGSILASLDTRGLRAQLASANAVIEEARAAVLEAASTENFDKAAVLAALACFVCGRADPGGSAQPRRALGPAANPPRLLRPWCV